MNVTFKNFDTGNDITLESDKSLIVIYGKNGSGKTTLSRCNYFDKKFVFNDDFIYSNVYTISDSGASQTTVTKENFSGLWLGEDIVNVRKEISRLVTLEKQIKDEYQSEYNKLLNFFSNYQIPVNLQHNINFTVDKTFVLDVPNYEQQKLNYNVEHIYYTDIDSKEKFEEQLVYYKKNDVYNMLISKIKNNKLLSELIFSENNEYVNLLNEVIKKLIEQKDLIIEIEKIFEEDNITLDLKNKIREWYNIHKDKNKCLFCGNSNIDDALTKWKKVFLNEHYECKHYIINQLKNDLDYCETIVSEKSYASVDKDIVEVIINLISYLKDMINNIEKNTFEYFEFKIKCIKKDIVDRNDLINNLVNFVFNKRKNKIGFLFNAQIYVNKLKKEKLIYADQLMDEKGMEIAGNINDKFKKFGLNKNINISVDKHSTPHKFTFSINNHRNINELSDGQKHKLALAIFMNYLEDQDLSYKTIVIDDPVVSLDISSYILFKKYLINDLIKNHFKDNTKLILLTHDITYLYIQLSNIFDDPEMRSLTQIFKLNGEHVENIPISFIKTDDITLFKDLVINMTNLTELRILNSIINKIFRIEIDLKLRFSGLSITNDIGIDKLQLDEEKKEKMKHYSKHILTTSRRNHPSDLDIQQSLEYLKCASEILGFNEFITDDDMQKIDKIIRQKIDGEIRYDLFRVVESVQKFLKSNNDQDFKNYVEHTRNSYTRNIIGLGLDDYYN